VCIYPPGMSAPSSSESDVLLSVDTKPPAAVGEDPNARSRSSLFMVLVVAFGCLLLLSSGTQVVRFAVVFVC
jgi:hypothetical protein